MRRFPFVALFVHFPGLWLATFKAHIAARISGTTETDFVPGKGMSIVCFYRILHQQHPVASHGQLLPDVVTCRGITVVNGLEYRVLIARPKLGKRLAIHMLCHSLNPLQPKAMGIAIGWHIFVAIAINAPRVEPLIDCGHNRNFMCLVAVVLWQYAVADRLHQIGLSGCEEANRGDMLDTIQHDLARGLIPKSLLRERLETRVVAGLGRWRQRLFCGWVQRQTAFVYPLRCTLWCVRGIYRILPFE